MSSLTAFLGKAAMGFELMNTARDVVPRRRVEELAVELQVARRRLFAAGAPRTELLAGKDERQERISVLCEDAREVISVQQRIYPLDVMLKWAPRDQRVVASGVRFETFWDTRNLSLPMLEWLSTYDGPQYCCYGPVQLKIFDGERVLIDGPIVDGIETVLHTWDAGVVATAQLYVRAVRATAVLCADFLDRQRLANHEPGDQGALLTERQRRVAALLDAGATDDEVAREVRVSVRTVRSEVAAILQLLGARNRFGAGRRYASLTSVQQLEPYHRTRGEHVMSGRPARF